MDNSCTKSNAHHTAKHKRKRNILLGIIAAFLLVAVIATAAINISQKNTITNKAHGVIKSTCATTLYPDLCVSSLVAAPSKIKTSMDVIMAALNLAISNVKLNKAVIHKIAAGKALNVRQKGLLKDCLENEDQSLEELQRVSLDLKNYPWKNYSIDDVMTFLSAAMSNQQSCIDGFSHNKGDKRVRSGLIDGQLHVFKLCSNVLAMVKNMTTAATYHSHEQERRLEEVDEHEHGWPKWLSAGDRRLLQATSVTPDVTVAADGSGNYRTVSEAVAAAASGSSKRYVIKIKAGVYREYVNVPSSKTDLMFIGDGQKKTIITGNRNHEYDGSTYNSATVGVGGRGFLARDITFENTAGASKHQAVALRVNADKSAFYRCSMIAFQDTLYVHTLRQFYVKCIVIGTIDFIFGYGSAVFQDCDLHARRPNPQQRNMITAHGRGDPNENTGIVIQKCRIGATSDLQGQQGTYPTYLGRPWGKYSRTVVMQTQISNIVHPAGWYPWSGNFALDTLFYAEYQNTGPGADTSKRVNWPGYRVLKSSSEAQPFTAGNFISGGSWLASTGFPYSLGL